jgi:hypothetical protein
VIEATEKLKKKKYLQPCLNQRRHFTPFIVSVDSLVGKEATTVLKVFAARTATKVGTYSSVMGYMRARLIIAIIRATHIYLRGSRNPMSRSSNRQPQWEDPAGMTLMRFWKYLRSHFIEQSFKVSNISKITRKFSMTR